MTLWRITVTYSPCIANSDADANYANFLDYIRFATPPQQMLDTFQADNTLLTDTPLNDHQLWQAVSAPIPHVADGIPCSHWSSQWCRVNSCLEESCPSPTFPATVEPTPSLAETMLKNMTVLEKYSGKTFPPQVVDAFASNIEPLKDSLARFYTQKNTVPGQPTVDDLGEVMKFLEGNDQLDDFMKKAFEVSGAMFLMSINYLVGMTLLWNPPAKLWRRSPSKKIPLANKWRITC